MRRFPLSLLTVGLLLAGVGHAYAADTRIPDAAVKTA